MKTILWSLAAFFVGSIPFSFILGKLVLAVDIREYGDGNPGAANAWRAGGWKLGMLAVLLDYGKGILPVGLASLVFGVSGWNLVPVAVAPVAGHAFSPFLAFQGGKAVAATFGIWTGLTLTHILDGPLALGVCMGIFYLFQSTDVWTVVLGMLCFAMFLVLRNAGSPILAIWAITTAIVFWKHRREMKEAMRLRPFFAKVFRRQH